MRLTLSEIATALGIAHAGPNPVLGGAAIDSRKAGSGDLFVCLPGARTDGHDFAQAAVANGAAAILAARPLPRADAPVLVVDDPEKALGRLAAFWRKRFRGAVAVITGTCGKTTTKEALAAILRRRGKTAATAGNLNNQLGLPLTILNADGDEEFWVLEAGISRPGDMEYLGAIARPDLALILNAGAGHAEGLGEKGAAWHKAQLLRFLNEGGRAIVNGDYRALAAEAARIYGDVSFFSCKDDASEYFARPGQGPGRYELRLEGNWIAAATPMRGCAGCENALAASAAAHCLGASTEQIRAGLQEMPLADRRGCQRDLGPFHIIDASYNANPLSMRAMLEEAAAASRRLQKPLVCVLGSMLELGAGASSAHRELGRELAMAAPAAVFWKGEWQEDVRIGLSGAEQTEFAQAGAPCETARLITGNLSFRDGAVVLVQGSRANRLDEYADALGDALDGGCHVL